MPDIFRVGRINFINTLPVYHYINDVNNNNGLKDKIKFVQEAPAVLNTMLYNNQLDLSSVSSVEYALHAHLYKVIPNLSIASKGAVKSVKWYGRVTFENMHNKYFVVTKKSLTASYLSKILFSEFFHIKPLFLTDDIDNNLLDNDDIQGFLTIGDDALLNEIPGEKFPFHLDLGQLWFDLTQKPFVFGVWAIRNDSYSKFPEISCLTIKELYDSKNIGVAKIRNIADNVAEIFPVSADKISNYLSNLHYDLKPQYIEGMKLFFQYLYKYGLVKKQVNINYFNRTIN